MKINLAKSAGFCFGVKRALNIALSLAGSPKGKNVEMLGDIVHNEDVVCQIRRTGIKKIKRFGRGAGKTLLIRAHGASNRVMKEALRRGYNIVDATCLMVKDIHKIVMEMEKEGFTIIVIGDKKHEEVKGIVGQLQGAAVIIEDERRIPRREIRRIAKACVVVQSTQNLDKAQKIVEALRKRIGDLRFFNTICAPTRLKQQEIKIMPLKNDVMVIIGSKTSANTKRLFEISRSLNNKTYWVTSKKELKRGWFTGAGSVGVTSGASTPDAATHEVIDEIKRLAGGKDP